MNYQECLDFLYNRLPMFQNQGKSAYKKDLTNTLALLEHLGNPHLDTPFIHVGGTNGKGSVSSMLAATLTQSGRKTGLYTSPHLLSYKERIRIDGNEIDEAFIVDFVNQTRQVIERINPSFFEVTVAMAFEYFKRNNVDIAVIEVGLGGRLDSTNVITPLLSVITSIGWDHMDLLGNTLESIAFEKAGIIKAKTPVVCSSAIEKSALTVIERKATEMNAPFYLSEFQNNIPDFLALKGTYQLHNYGTYLKSIQVLNKLGFDIEEPIQKTALENIVRLSGLRGRWECLKSNPEIICDTGHNAEAIPLLMEQLSQEYPNKQKLIIWGMVSDKDRGEILKLLPKEALYFVCKPSVIRGYDAQLLCKEMQLEGLTATAFDSISSAIDSAVIKSSENDSVIFIGGSTFLVADALSVFE